MINYWWVTRPKRKLDSIPEVLAVFSEISLNEEWEGQRKTHLSLEDALEEAGLKRVGDRRDQTGGGARTYRAWLISLGLIFTQQSSGQTRLTLAGEAIMNGKPPVKVLTNQILKYQFPSSYSIGRGVRVHPRFHIRPFRFLLKLLSDPNVKHLTEEEIAKVIIVNAENESDDCYNEIVRKISDFRKFGNNSLSADFLDDFAPSKGIINLKKPYAHLLDTANTIKNWLEYTQLVKMDSFDKKIRIISEKLSVTKKILSEDPQFIDRPEQHEYFQRKFGVDPDSKKDTRNLTQSKTITPLIIAEHKIRQAFISESIKSPISRITPNLVNTISEKTGLKSRFVESVLIRLFPHGAVSSFMTKYFELAHSGREQAVDFEKATAKLFAEILNFESYHIGSIGLTPDVLVFSKEYNIAGIIENKAIQNYSISNDHRNRMIQNYLKRYEIYSPIEAPLGFFLYIAGSFSNSINTQISSIVLESGIKGSAISVTSLIALLENHAKDPYGHAELLRLFTTGRQVISFDFQ